MNDFQADLVWSHEQSGSKWWERCYRQAFVDFAGMRYIANDGWAQRAGIDRQVFLSGGRVLNIDEKVRRKDWPDIVIEYWSSEEDRAPGWIAKSLAIDYLAYAFEPSSRCYLLPFQTLRRAWKINRKEWTRCYPPVRADNKRWTTVSVAVPIPVLLDAVKDAMFVKVQEVTP